MEFIGNIKCSKCGTENPFFKESCSSCGTLTEKIHVPAHIDPLAKQKVSAEVYEQMERAVNHYNETKETDDSVLREALAKIRNQEEEEK